MKPWLICFYLLLASTLHAQPSRHVVLISIDGFHPDMYLDSSWPAPNLRHLMTSGVYADHLLSVFPAYTYPSHTAMLTGALPARSGIYFNQPKGSHGEWNWFAANIKTPTLWQGLHRQGLTSAAVEWPVSVGAEINWNCPEIWSVDHPDDRITEARKYATPGLVAELEANATGKLDSTNMSDGRFSLDENAGRIAGYIFRKYKPAFLALHFAEVDGEEHDQGRDGDSVRLALECNDRAIGDILEAIQLSGLKDSTTIIIVGDHGFATINTLFRPNMLIRHVPAKFVAAGGSAFLYANPTASIDDRRRIIRQVKAALDSLPSAQRKRFRIMDRPELDQLGADSAAILALSGVPGLVFSGGLAATNHAVNYGPGTTAAQQAQDGLFVPVTGGHHGYDPRLPAMYTGFIAAGAGIRKGQHITELRETDIAPLVARLLGVTFTCPDGKLVEGILK
jgi:predicted AlkP superfamily pyrophosphatase or phosphodiesterase